MFTGFFFTCYGDHRYLHGLTPSFPTRRSSDLATVLHADLSTSTKTVANLGGGSTADVDAGDVLEYTITLIESAGAIAGRSEEHTSELQSLMRISYAVFCLKKKNKNK